MKKISLGFIFITILAAFIGPSMLFNTPLDILSLKKPLKAGPSDFNVLEFWDNIIPSRVESVPINLSYIGEPGNRTFNGKNYTMKEISFDSPNWVDAESAKIRLNGTIVYPEDVSGNVPGALVMHGLLAKRSDMLSYAMEFVEMGCVALMHDHPGHGDSEGAEYDPSNFYFQGDFDKTAHIYLTICGAIQATRVLESLPEIDLNNIIATGHSYGALNTMYLASVYSDHIKAALPIAAVGGWEHIAAEDAFYSVMGVSKTNLDANFFTNQALRVDPKYYIQTPDLPPIFFRIGTSDDFFTHPCINTTFNAVLEDKWFQVHPNGKHGLFNDKPTGNFFLNYSVFGGPPPPAITRLNPEKSSNAFGDTVTVKFSVDSSVKVKKVELAYKYYNVLGDPWRITEIYETSSGSGTWEGTINPGILLSYTEYLIIVHLDTPENVWFTSQIYSASIILSNFTLITIIGMICVVIIPSFFLVRRRYIKNVKEVDESIRNQAQKYLMLEIGLIALTEVIIYLSLFLPWVYFNNGVVIWTHAYIFNNMMTWTDIFGVFSYYLAFGLLGYWLVCAFISLFKPMIGGWLASWYPFAAMGIIVMFGGGGLSSGSIVLGLGLILPFIAALSHVLIGIWKRKYQAKIGLR